MLQSSKEGLFPPGWQQLSEVTEKFVGGGGQTILCSCPCEGDLNFIFTKNLRNQGLEEKLIMLRAEHHGGLTCH